MLSKKQLHILCKQYKIKGYSSKSKEELLELLQEQQYIPINTLESNSNKEIKTNDIKYIYHLADIHIRVLDRHKEYQEVFNNLYKYLQNQQELEKSVLIICGDIFHNRDRLISETILLFDKFLEDLSQNIDIIIIPGNHDIFTHNDRLDTISGIINIKKYPRVLFLKNSGIYHYKNIVFGFSSLLDNKFIKANEINDNKFKIALYHGIINGCKLDNGFTVADDTSNIKTSDFDGYNLVLLGDVHKHQFIKNNIAYAGSLIQQSFKEIPFEHGLIKWTINNNKDVNGEFIKIKNNYGFIKVLIENGIIVHTNNYIFPTYSKVKLLLSYKDTDTDTDINLNNIKNEIELKYNTQVISISKEIQQDDLREKKIELLSSNSTHLSKDEYEYTILKNLIINSNNEDIKNEILTLHKNEKDIISVQTTQENLSYPWEITELEFKNVFIYGNDHINHIDFENKKGIIGILGDNAKGKTSILNAILYGLFGTLYKTRQQLNKNIIHKNSKNFYIKITIKIERIYYTIERIGKNKKRGGNITMDDTIEFKRIDKDTGEITNLTETNKLTTIEKIKKVLCITDRDQFLLTNVISNTSYGNSSSILSMSNSELELTFNTLFNTNIYSQIYKSINKQYKSKNEIYSLNIGEIQQIQKTILDDIHINKIRQDISLYNQEKITIEEKLKILKLYLEDIEKEININENEISKIVLTEDEINENIRELTEKLSIYTHETIQFIIDNEENINKRLTIIENELEQNKCNNLHINNKTYKNYNFNNLDDIDKEINKINESIQNLIDSKEVIQEIQIQDYIKAKNILKTYDNIDDIDNKSTSLLIDDLNELEIIDNNKLVIRKDLRDKIIEILKNTTNISINDIIKYKSLIKQKEDNDNKIEKNTNINQEVLNFKELLKELNKLKINLLVKEFNKLENQLDIIDDYNNLIENKNLLNKIQDYKGLIPLVTKKNNYKDEIKVIEKELIDIIQNIIKLEYRLNENNKRIKEKINQEEKLNKIKKELDILKVYREFISDKNLPKLLLKDTIKLVMYEANKIIYTMTNLQVLIEDNIEDNGKWEIFIKKNNLILGSEQCSGYERFIINIGLKVGLDKFKHYAGIKMFFIDECFDCISEENLEKVDDLFEILKKNYQTILVISHNEELKKKINYQININSDYICSQIV